METGRQMKSGRNESEVTHLHESCMMMVVMMMMMTMTMTMMMISHYEKLFAIKTVFFYVNMGPRR